MRIAAEQTNRGYKLNAITLSAPVRGWNTQALLSDTPQGYALKLDNFVISSDAIEVRAQTGKVVNIDALIETIEPYDYTDNKKIFATGEGNFYDCDYNLNAYRILKSGFLNNRWQSFFYEGYKYFLNGNDKPQVYSPGEEGDTLQDADFVEENEGVPFDSVRLIAGTAYKNRLYMIERDTLAFHYTTAAGAKSGPIKKFDLAQVSQYGGKLLIVLPWTYSSSAGAQESQLVFITSMGEVLIYAGDNPAEPQSWALRGTYKIPRPLGYRCAAISGNDIAYISESGYYMLSNLLATPVAQRSVAFSAAINKQVSNQKATFSSFGWELKIWPAKDMMLANTPQIGASIEQHILNTQNGGWSKFSGIKALSWCPLGDQLFYCGQGGIYKYDTPSDENIRWAFALAYTNMGNPLIKVIKRLEVFLQAYKTLKFNATAAVDFNNTSTIYKSSPALPSAKWDISKWDATKWPSEQTALCVKIMPALKTGSYFSFGLGGQTAGQPVRFISINVFFEQGINLN